MVDARTREGRATLRAALPPRRQIAPNCTINNVPAHDLLNLLDAADERDRLREALEKIASAYPCTGDRCQIIARAALTPAGAEGECND